MCRAHNNNNSRELWLLQFYSNAHKPPCMLDKVVVNTYRLSQKSFPCPLIKKVCHAPKKNATPTKKKFTTPTRQYLSIDRFPRPPEKVCHAHSRQYLSIDPGLVNTYRLIQLKVCHAHSKKIKFATPTLTREYATPTLREFATPTLTLCRAHSNASLPRPL